ncbi:methionyl-tRNA formyltransferase [Candidatus Woesearchaeota archaeon]|nr:methionyl-tRNA formyltransferase [Candidatus Woesearchaeota archaeon]
MPLKITVMIDNKDSYLNDYVSELIKNIKGRGHELEFISNPAHIKKGDILFILGCNSILSNKMLGLNKHNIVVHPSKLPEGRGSAALVNQILEGKNVIYITLFEAAEKIDSGDYYFQEPIIFEGHELSDEIRHKQTFKVFELVLRFLDSYPNLKPKKQAGNPTFCKRRTLKDSELNIDKTIREQFNLLRVVDNKRYPAFFVHMGNKYVLHIFKEKDLEK